MTEVRILEAPAGTVVLKPTVTRLDAVAARDFRPGAVEAAKGRSLVILILEDVAFIDSTGLGCLVSILKAVTSGGQVRLVGIQPSVRALLALTRLDRVFRSFDDLASALAA